MEKGTNCYEPEDDVIRIYQTKNQQERMILQVSMLICVMNVMEQSMRYLL